MLCEGIKVLTPYLSEVLPHILTVCSSVMAQFGLLQGRRVGLGGGIRVVRSASNTLLTQ